MFLSNMVQVVCFGYLTSVFVSMFVGGVIDDCTQARTVNCILISAHSIVCASPLSSYVHTCCYIEYLYTCC